jgi:hypothetical protein
VVAPLISPFLVVLIGLWVAISHQSIGAMETREGAPQRLPMNETSFTSEAMPADAYGPRRFEPRPHLNWEAGRTHQPSKNGALSCKNSIIFFFLRMHVPLGSAGAIGDAGGRPVGTAVSFATQSQFPHRYTVLCWLKIAPNGVLDFQPKDRGI